MNETVNEPHFAEDTVSFINQFRNHIRSGNKILGKYFNIRLKKNSYIVVLICYVWCILSNLILLLVLALNEFINRCKTDSDIIPNYIHAGGTVFDIMKCLEEANRKSDVPYTVCILAALYHVAQKYAIFVLCDLFNYVITLIVQKSTNIFYVHYFHGMFAS